jgi:glycosyltransferase involved in cell wall biosynthesis
VSRCWAILSGAYPPGGGGVSDYTQQVARGLAAAGDRVHVYTAAMERVAAAGGGVQLHGLPDGFTLAGLAALDEALDRLPAEREILVQYTPYAFGWSGMNLALPAWLRWRIGRSERRRDAERVTVMFHEVMYPLHRLQPLRHTILGHVHGLMGRLLTCSATRVLVATPRWSQILRELCGADRGIEWAAVPSNLPTCVAPARVRLTRASVAPGAGLLVGHFGTYGKWFQMMLLPLVAALLRADGSRRFLLVGRGSHEFRRQLIDREPAVEDRVRAAGDLDASATAEHLAACDLLVQPYPDGITTRRSTAMAGLALGRAVVTNSGGLTEPLWAESRAVALAAEPSVDSVLQCIAPFLRAPSSRAVLAERGRALYEQQFALHRTIDILRNPRRS